MDTFLAIAGVLSILLAAGHATLGLAWVLRGVPEDVFGKTPFGDARLSAATVHASWHIVTVFALASGTLLLLLATDLANPKLVVLRVFSGMWLGVATVAVWTGGRRVRRARDLLRFPVPVFFVLVAALCWFAST